MTEHGDAYEGERRKGKLTARAKAGKGLDPVGKEDKDIDNDGDVDKTCLLLTTDFVDFSSAPSFSGMTMQFGDLGDTSPPFTFLLVH